MVGNMPDELHIEWRASVLDDELVALTEAEWSLDGGTECVVIASDGSRRANAAARSSAS